MSVGYRSIQWNPAKVRYDLVAAAGVAIYLATFVAVGSMVHSGDRGISLPILLMRAVGTAAFVMLHIILCIGPLCRFDRRFLPILYNRRHLGVITFLLGIIHALLTLGFYHGFGVIAAPLSLLESNARVGSASAFPFEWFGVFALIVLFLMAATSHDFWLANLSPRIWKWLHMMVYPAYVALILHVSLGALQSERGAIHPILLGIGIVMVSVLHVAAGRREVRNDADVATPADKGRAIDETGDWIDICDVSETRVGRGRVVRVNGGERIALFRVGDCLSAVSNVCAHQGGPLGEGRVVDGCVTCPWHGYQYRAHDGCAPPPFTEKLPTFRVRIRGTRVEVDPNALPPGTPVEPALIPLAANDTSIAGPIAEVAHV